MTTTEKKIQKVKTKEKEVKKPKVVPMPDQVQNKRVEDLVNGKVESPNDFVSYKISQVKEIQAQSNLIVNNIGQLENRLNQLKQEMIMLEGKRNQCIDDIKAWDKNLENNPEKEKEKKEDGE